MPASRRWLFTVLVCLSLFAVPMLATAQSDQEIAERVLGPQWKQLSRKAGIVFSGTVLSTRPHTTGTDPMGTDSAKSDAGAVPSLELSFRVDHPIAGVERGQVLTIHEWLGARTLQRAMRSGERFLIFLYPLSRLGFTSPVGGSQGQIPLDATGTRVIEKRPLAPTAGRLEMSPQSSPFAPPPDRPDVTVSQLERAIRAARRE